MPSKKTGGKVDLQLVMTGFGMEPKPVKQTKKEPRRKKTGVNLLELLYGKPIHHKSYRTIVSNKSKFEKSVLGKVIWTADDPKIKSNSLFKGITKLADEYLRNSTFVIRDIDKPKDGYGSVIIFGCGCIVHTNWTGSQFELANCNKLEIGECNLHLNSPKVKERPYRIHSRRNDRDQAARDLKDGDAVDLQPPQELIYPSTIWGAKYNRLQGCSCTFEIRRVNPHNQIGRGSLPIIVGLRIVDSQNKLCPRCRQK